MDIRIMRKSFCMIRIENEIVKGDSEQYVRHGLHSIFTKSHLPIPNAGHVTRLTELADNLYIFVSIVLRYIGDYIARDRLTRLGVILGDNKVCLQVDSLLGCGYAV